MNLVAAIQMASGPNVNANLLEAERLFDEAAQRGARLVVLPENFAFVGQNEKDILEVAEADGEGPIQSFLVAQAKRRKLWIVAGTIPIRGQQADRVRGACMVYDDQGERRVRYDKMHMFDVIVPGSVPNNDEHYIESATMEPGDDIAIVDTPFGRLGLAVCYDLRFPELFRALVNQGAEMIALPSAFTAETGRAHWEVLVRARAIENLCYVVAAAQGGYHLSGRETYGNSMIVDPWGMVLAIQPRGSAAVVAELDLNRQAAIRKNFPVISHQRLACYPTSKQ